MSFVPVVDISHHQGAIDFAVMRRRGIDDLIIRVTNGDTHDKQAHAYYIGAVAAGFDPRRILWYTFVNPKRCYPNHAVQATIDRIRQITGRDDHGLMWDCETFIKEAGTRGPGEIKGAEYANYMRSLMAGVHRLAPNWRQFGYSNAAFWDSWVGLHGDDIVASLEWIVARYPVHSDAGYDKYPVPGDPDDWAAWANARQPMGPLGPRGAPWSGWQFSADYNGMGRYYGCSSSALDLNIVQLDPWLRWTGRTAAPEPEEPDMAQPNPRYFRTPASPTAVWGTTDGFHAFKVTHDAAQARIAAGFPFDVEVLTADEAKLFDYIDSAEHGTIGIA